MFLTKKMQIKRLLPSRLKEAIEFADRIFKPKDGSMGKNFPVLFSKENAHNILIVEEDERIVAMAGMYYAYAQIFSMRVKTVFVGAVCTDEKYRGRGYATSMMYETEKIALENDATLMMIHGDNGIYRRFGAVSAGTYFTIRIEPNQDISMRDFRRATDKDIKKMAIWYWREPVKFVRPFPRFELFHKVGHTWDALAKTFINDSAYANFVRKERMNHCVEFAGDPIAIKLLIQDFANKYGPTMVHMNFANKECISALFSKTPRRRNFYGTMKVLDKFKLLEQLKDYLDEAINKSEKERLLKSLSRFNNSDFTKIVFGSTEEAPDFHYDVFPIPLPDYHGMDYI